MPITTPDEEFRRWLTEPEGMHLEFKAAQNDFGNDKLVRYCAALANEGGGKLILGVSDKRPRQITGSQAFRSPEQAVQMVTDKLRLRFDFEERSESSRRVLIFHIPPRFLGVPVAVDGAYLMRSEESLVSMTPDQLRRIFDEAGPDFSAQICSRATFADLAPEAIESFRARWIQKSGNGTLKSVPPQELLADAELIMDGGITHAALILFGTRKAQGRLGLDHAEVIFEYRSGEVTAHQAREEFRQGFFSFYDALWNLINLRNDLQSYQSGLFRYEIPTFSETAVREALLNAISHRDYRLGASVFVRQFPRHMEIVSPGGFPAGITAGNILEQQNPRNRRIAEAFARCGLIERAGQGMNRIFEESIRQSKPLPDFSGSAAHEVRLTLRGEVQNPAFLQFLEKLTPGILDSFSTYDWLVLNSLHRSEPVPEGLQPRLARLRNLGIIESLGRGRGTRYFLARALYAHIGQTGAYTREVGLDRQTNKELLVKHLKDNSPQGSPLSVLQQVNPALSLDQVRHLLRELGREDRAFSSGKGRGALWFSGPARKDLPKELPK